MYGSMFLRLLEMEEPSLFLRQFNTFGNKSVSTNIKDHGSVVVVVMVKKHSEQL